MKLNWWQRTVLRGLVPGLQAWLRDRALRLSLQRQAEIAKKLGVTVDQVNSVNMAVIEQAVAEVGKLV